MGTECFNGNHKDIDLQIKDNNNFQSRTNHMIHLKRPIHYQTSFKYKSNDKNNQYNNRFNNSVINVKTSNSLKLVNNGKQKKINNFSKEELNEQINDILRIRIPFFENSILKMMSAFTFLSGNGPYHEGLMFFTTNKNFYIAQSYPITFIKVFDFYHGISEIIRFNNLNSNSKKYSISEIYSPQEPILILDILKIINILPNKYNLLNDNCQNFCNNILESLNDNFKMEMDEIPNIEKINFLKNQKKIKGYNKNHYKKTSSRFDNL